MPRISRFYGISIYMFYNEHEPPHFHAKYSGFSAQVNIGSGQVTRGDIPRRARGLVAEWAVLHRPELLENWTLVQRRLPLKQVQPLE
ncbi:MAG TPA: DUF4160 domain-containing protein [Dehalococcoidia bacterium]|nr:DUF4160 domain-containing protein [Dehalococcoidia bacterium]